MKGEEEMPDYTKEELNLFVRLYGKLADRIEKIAPKLAPYYPSSMRIVGFSISYGRCVITTKYSDASDCSDPYDRHEFDVKYLAMSDEEIDAEIVRREEERRRLREERERKEYERLCAKYGKVEMP